MTHEMDRRRGESDEQYDARINQQAENAGQSRAEYEQAANERAGRPAKREPDGDSQETGTM